MTTLRDMGGKGTEIHKAAMACIRSKTFCSREDQSAAAGRDTTNGLETHHSLSEIHQLCSYRRAKIGRLAGKSTPHAGRSEVDSIKD